MSLNTLLKERLPGNHTFLFCSAPISPVSSTFSCPPRQPWALKADAWALSLYSWVNLQAISSIPRLLLWFLGTFLSHLRPHSRSFLSCPLGIAVWIFWTSYHVEAQSSGFLSHPSLSYPSSYRSHILKAPPDKSLFFILDYSIPFSSTSTPPSKSQLLPSSG